VRRPLALLLLTTLTACAASADAVLDRRHERVAQLGLATFVAENTDRQVKVVHCDLVVLGPFDPPPPESQALALDARQRDQLQIEVFSSGGPRPIPMSIARDGESVHLATTDGALTVELEARADWSRRVVELVVEAVHAGARSSSCFAVDDGGAALVPLGQAGGRLQLMVDVGMVSLTRRSAAGGEDWIDDRAVDHPAGGER
jgi:hypothetical protein